MTNRPRLSKTLLFAFLAIFSTLCATSVATASELTNTQKSKFAIVHPVGLGEVQWTDGFFAERFEVCRTQSIPAMWEIMKGTHYKPFLKHFLIAAGEAQGGYHGARWNDGDFYKFLEAACASLAIHPDAELEAIVEESISAIGRAQREDGYLHTPVLVAHRNGDFSVQPFQDRHNFEMYNMGHLITAAIMHHRVTGRENFLDIALATADFLYDTFHAPTSDLARNSVCPSHYMAMIELYRTTSEPRYLELAETFLRMRDLIGEIGGDDNQDRIPFSEQREAVGHAVRATYLYAGAADLFVETGDEDLWVALDAIWQNLVEKKMYITGACGALFDGASPYGSAQQETITRTHQSFGRNYELPNTTSHNETCAAIGNVLWNWRMYLITGEARYMDVLELALYNGILSGISRDGVDYFYVNPLRQVDPLPTDLRFSRTRVPFITSYCCPPNVLRILAAVNGYAYSKTDDSLRVNLYGSSDLSTTLAGETLKISQRTEYPWDGEVELTIEECPEDAFALNLRIPGWVETATLMLNNEVLDVELLPGTFAEIKRNWKSGDKVILQLAMPPMLVESHPLVEENRNQVALKRGPLVYCVESIDLPEGRSIHDITIPVENEFATSFDGELLGGVTRIEADGLLRETGPWDGKLYRSFQTTSEERVRIQFIPYFAWSNRGPSEMSVWLPVSR